MGYHVACFFLIIERLRVGSVIPRIGRKLVSDLDGNVRRWLGRHATQRRLPGGEAAVYRGPIWHIRWRAPAQPAPQISRPVKHDRRANTPSTCVRGETRVRFNFFHFTNPLPK